jgi:hypothetical protein
MDGIHKMVTLQSRNKLTLRITCEKLKMENDYV